MTDELMLLLSTDWFLPYWGEIGIAINDESKSCIQLGSRRIVTQIVGNAQWMFQADLTDRRKRETRASFLALIQRCGVLQELSGAFEEWNSRTEEDSSATWNFLNLNQIAVSDHSSSDYPELEVNIRSKVVQSWKLFNFDSTELREACSHSTTDWDIRIHAFLGGSAILSGLLVNLLRDRVLQSFWRHLRTSLTAEELYTLTSWYRAMTIAMTRGERPDLIPSYVK